jgi:hypothetical protein
VQGGQHGQPGGGAQRVDQVEYLLLVADVQRRGGLVKEQYPRFLRERPGQDDALPLPAGQAR